MLAAEVPGLGTALCHCRNGPSPISGSVGPSACGALGHMHPGVGVTTEDLPNDIWGSIPSSEEGAQL